MLISRLGSAEPNVWMVALNLIENGLRAIDELLAFVRRDAAFFDQALYGLDEIRQLSSRRREVALAVAQADEAARIFEQWNQHGRGLKIKSPGRREDSRRESRRLSTRIRSQLFSGVHSFYSFSVNPNVPSNTTQVVVAINTLADRPSI